MQFHNNFLSVQNIRTFLEYQPIISENNDAIEADGNGNTISFNNVSFHYGDDEKLVLKNISFTISPGEKIALVGHNGAGKSTLVKLLMRLYDPSDGNITLNVIPIQNYRLSSYRNLFAAVFQHYKVFSLSILQNILLRDNPDGTDIKKAAEGMKSSGIYDKVMSMPNRENTILTKEFDAEGVVLSGGEYQKIAIARVFTKPCQIVILDEPSSALDPIAEYKMYEAMMKSCENKSVIYISHRLSSAVLADTVYMMENGEIVERGTHAELISKNGKYADMWFKQAEQYQKGVKTDA
jgi:ATP-binding cassette subfamily B protein